MIPLLAATVAALLFPGPERTVSFPAIGPVASLQSSSIAANDYEFFIPWEQNGVALFSRVDPSGRLLDDTGVPLATAAAFLRGDRDHFISVAAGGDQLRWSLIANDGSVLRTTTMPLGLATGFLASVEKGSQSTLVQFMTSDSMIHGRLFTNDGVPITNWIDLGTSSYGKFEAAAGPNGFLLTDISLGSNGWVPSARFLSAAGALGAWQPLAASMPQMRNTLRIRVAFDGTRYVVVWNDLNSLRSVALTPAGDLVSGPSTIVQDPDPNGDYWLSRLVAHGGVTTVIYEKAGNGAFGADLFGLDLGSGYERIVAPGVHPDDLQVAVIGNAVLLYANGVARLLGDSAPFAVARSGHEQRYPQIAAGLIVWEEDGRIRARREGDAFDVSDSATTCVSPIVAFDGSTYLVAWIDTAGGNEYRAGRLFARRIDLSGRFVDPVAFLVTNVPVKNPAIAYGDGVYLIVFESLGNTGRDILAARVLPSGTVMDTPPLDLSNERNAEFTPDVAFGNGRFLVTWLWNDWFGGHTIPNNYAMAAFVDHGVASVPMELSGTNDPTASAPKVAWTDAGFAAAWQSTAGTMLKRFNATDVEILKRPDPALSLARVASVSGDLLLVYTGPEEAAKIVGEYPGLATFTIAEGANQPFVAGDAIVYRRVSREQPASGAGLVRVRVFDQSANPRRRAVNSK